MTRLPRLLWQQTTQTTRLFEIGKGTMLRVLKTGINFDLLGDFHAPFPDVMKQATQFITSCYGQQHCDSMSEARIRVWTVRTGKPGTTNVHQNSALFPQQLKHSQKMRNERTCKHAFGNGRWKQIHQNLTQVNMVGFKKKNLNLFSFTMNKHCWIIVESN